MPAFIDLRGIRHGRLMPRHQVRIALSSGREVIGWECACDCGKVTTVHASHLRSGRTRSCGCLWAEEVPGRVTHGATKTRELWAWDAMLRRCYNPNVVNFKYYGERGIRVCDRWRYGENGLSGYSCFLCDMGLRPDGMTLDRINVDGDYLPENCRWATAKLQAQNKRARR